MTNDSGYLGLAGGFLRSAARAPEHVALEVDGARLTYAELRAYAQRVAATLTAHRADEGAPLTCVLGQRSAAGFAGILGALCSGHGYVPMLPSYPAARLLVMIERARARRHFHETVRHLGASHMDDQGIEARAALRFINAGDRAVVGRVRSEPVYCLRRDRDEPAGANDRGRVLHVFPVDCRHGTHIAGNPLASRLSSIVSDCCRKPRLCGERRPSALFLRVEVLQPGDDRIANDLRAFEFEDGRKVRALNEVQDMRKA